MVAYQKYNNLFSLKFEAGSFFLKSILKMLYTWANEESQHLASSLETSLICANYNLCKNLSRLTWENAGSYSRDFTVSPVINHNRKPVCVGIQGIRNLIPHSRNYEGNGYKLSAQRFLGLFGLKSGTYDWLVVALNIIIRQSQLTLVHPNDSRNHCAKRL